MTLEELIAMATSLADDVLPDEEVTNYVNDGIAAINIELETNFPSLIEMDEEPVFPDKWQRMLLVPFAKARIKEKDSSQFEWEIGYEQFFENLTLFKKGYDIPEEYRDSDSKGSISKNSIIDNVPYAWGGW